MKPEARLRWLHPFFEDMAEEWNFNYYGQVLSGRYAGKVGGSCCTLGAQVAVAGLPGVQDDLAWLCRWRFKGLCCWLGHATLKAVHHGQHITAS